MNECKVVNKEPDRLSTHPKKILKNGKVIFIQNQEIKSLLPITKDDYRDGHSITIQQQLKS